MKNTIKDFNSLPTNLRYLLLEARKKNYRISAIPISDSSKSDTNVYQITNNKKIMSITNDNHYPDLYFNTKFLTKHKFFTYKILKRQGIVMPLTFFFDSIEKVQKSNRFDQWCEIVGNFFSKSTIEQWKTWDENIFS
ncbi:MAG: hypothetical protein IIA17_08165 [candidate division Zixibacteria bacterium]|nr:hypothetical protein [candidate division Zixibacteria bacterium]